MKWGYTDFTVPTFIHIHTNTHTDTSHSHTHTHTHTHTHVCTFNLFYTLDVLMRLLKKDVPTVLWVYFGSLRIQTGSNLTPPLLGAIEGHSTRHSNYNPYLIKRLSSTHLSSPPHPHAVYAATDDSP